MYLVSEINLNLWLYLKEWKYTGFLYLWIWYTTLLIIWVSRGFYPKLSNWLLSQWLWPVHQLTSSFGVFKCFVQVSAASESGGCKSLWLNHIVSVIYCRQPVCSEACGVNIQHTQCKHVWQASMLTGLEVHNMGPVTKASSLITAGCRCVCVCVRLSRLVLKKWSSSENFIIIFTISRIYDK